MEAVGNLDNFRPKVVRKLALSISSAISLTQTQLDDSIRDGLGFLNNYEPNRKVYEAAGDGSSMRFDLVSIIPEWIQQTSSVNEVESVSDPNTSDEEVQRFELESWRTSRDATNKDILFLSTTIDSSNYLRIHYTQPHTIEDLDSATATTVPQKMTEVLSLLSVSFAANTVAMIAAEMANTSLGADQVDFGSLHQRYMDVAKRRMNQALEVLAPNSPVDSAGAKVEWQSRSFLTPEGRIGH